MFDCKLKGVTKGGPLSTIAAGARMCKADQ